MGSKAQIVISGKCQAVEASTRCSRGQAVVTREA